MNAKFSEDAESFLFSQSVQTNQPVSSSVTLFFFQLVRFWQFQEAQRLIETYIVFAKDYYTSRILPQI